MKLHRIRPLPLLITLTGAWLITGHGEATWTWSPNWWTQETEQADVVVVAYVRDVTDRQAEGEAWSEGSVEIVEVLKGEVSEAELQVGAKRVAQPVEEPWMATGQFAQALATYHRTMLKVGGPGILFLKHDPQTKRWLYHFGVKASEAAVNAIRHRASGQTVAMPPPYWISEDHVPSQ